MRLGAATKLIGFAIAVAVPAAACTGGSGDEAATTAAPPATSTAETQPAAPLPPSDFAADAAPFRVILTWEPPPQDVERFELFREGAPLALQPGSTTSYTDEDVVPGRVYNYEIASQSGELVTGRLHVSVETPVPSLRAARLAGTFNVATRFTSKTGYGEYSRPSYGWRFVPRCREGPCTVVWRDIHDTGFRSQLERRAARYRGTYTGQIGMECESAPMTSTIKVDLRVVAAEVIGGEWLAKRLRGTIDQTDAAQLGCRSGAATMAVRAHAAR